MIRFGSKPVRRGFTLIEFLISVAICMILMAGLYFAVDIQTRSTRVGREVVEEAMLARAVLDLVAKDIEPAVTVVQPFRFRKGSLAYGTSSSSTDSSGTTGTSSGNSGSSSGSTSGSATSASGGSTSSGASGTSSNSGSSSSSSSGSGTSSTGTSSEESTSIYGPALIPPGVVGFPESLTLYIRRDPRLDEQGGPAAGVHRITFGMIPSESEDGDGQGQGLGRWEIKLAQSELGLNPDQAPPADQFELVAPEVKAVRFKYHAGDGGDWLEQWDSRSTGSDEVTPQGPPRAIRIEMDIQVGKDGPLQTFFRVVQIPVGNTPALPPPTTTSSSGSTSP